MKKNFIRLVLMLATALWLSAPVQEQSGTAVQNQDGLHYFMIEGAPVVPEGTNEVVEVFSYMCSHCNTFEPYINSWAKRNAENVKFSKIPVVFGRKAWEIYARAFVTAQMMGLGDEAHAALMEAIWKDKAVMRSMEDLAEFYSQFGVDPKSFIATSKSFAVDARMRKEQRQIQTYGIRATPSVVLNGKYRIAGNEAVPSFDVMLDVLDYLIAAEAN